MSPISETVRQLATPGKGLLAGDEAVPIVRPQSGGALAGATSVALRAAYYELLFSTAGLGRAIGGVCLFEETLRQRVTGGRSLVDLLTQRGIVVGAKLDTGTVPFGPGEREEIADGLDGIEPRLIRLRHLGARFVKWRAPFRMESGSVPTPAAIRKNAERIATAALRAQHHDLVPLIDLSMSRIGTHSLARAASITNDVLDAVFSALDEEGADPANLVIQVPAVLPGSHASGTITIGDIAELTLEAVGASVPSSVRLVAIGASHESPDISFKILRSVARRWRPPLCPISFSLGYPFQREILAAWGGEDAKAMAAQEIAMTRAGALSEALLGSRKNG